MWTPVHSQDGKLDHLRSWATALAGVGGFGWTMLYI